MRVALVHDWLTGMRGGELVLAEIARLFPDAPIYTLVHRPGSLSDELEQRDIRTSRLQPLSFGGRVWRPYLGLMPAAIEGLDLGRVDLVISTSHAVAKGVIPPLGAYHISYIHTPMRYAWDQRAAYLRTIPTPLRWLAQLQLNRLRQWDTVSSARVDRLVANSHLVAWRVRHYWNRSAEVLPPPVDTEFFTPGGDRGGHLLTVAALVPYKRVDMAIDVAAATGRPLEVIGAGPLRRRLEAGSTGDVRFRGWVPREQLRAAYRSAAAVIVPNVEDFGIVTAEALACGTPVIGVGTSGTADIVRDGRDGVLAEAPTVEALTAATEQVLATDWDPEALRRRALAFSRDRFVVRFRSLLDRSGFRGVAA